MKLIQNIFNKINLIIKKYIYIIYYYNIIFTIMEVK